MTGNTAARLRAIPALTGKAPDLNLVGLPEDPVALFYIWLDTAIEHGVPEPHATTLATVDSDGVPDARTLLIKDVDDRGWGVAGPASSRKAFQLSSRPTAARNFWWQPIVRAIRVRGTVLEASRTDSEADLAARGAAARADVSPDDWTLWRVQPTRVEFGQGSPDRRHVRIVYELNDTSWTLTTTRGGDVIAKPGR